MKSVKLTVLALVAISSLLVLPAWSQTSVALGPNALASQSSTNLKNTAVGEKAGEYITSGYGNTAIGQGAMVGTSATPLTGSGNTAIGAGALEKLQGGASDNVAVGQAAGLYVGAGTNEVAIGQDTMVSSPGNPLTGGYNTAIGNDALYSIQGTATDNTAAGGFAGNYISTGDYNVVIGYAAMYGASNALTTGNGNIAIGYQALKSVQGAAAGNTALGYEAGYAGTALTTGGYNTFIGHEAEALTATDTNELVIGASVTGGGSNTTTIGNSRTTSTYFPGGVLNVAGSAGISSSGVLCSVTFTTVGGIVTACSGTSDTRLKTDLRPYSRGLEAVMALHPMKFHWNETGQKITGYSPETEQTGFIAQDVQQAMPEATGTESHDGIDYLTVRDRPIIAALVSAVKEQQKEIEALTVEVEQLKNKQ